MEGQEIAGRITSSRMSPTLGRSGCVAQVPSRLAAPGTQVTVRLPDGQDIQARVTPQLAHHDPEGTRTHGLTLTDCTPLAKVAVASRQTERHGVRFGRTAREEDGTLVVGSGPGEWLLIGPPGQAADLDDDLVPDGAALRTAVAAVATDIIRDDTDGTRSYLLHCERSVGQYLFDALLQAGAEYGLAVDGFRPAAM